MCRSTVYHARVQQNRFATHGGRIPAPVGVPQGNLGRAILLAGVNGTAITAATSGADMDDGSTPRHAPGHMPPPDAAGSPQRARDAPLHGAPEAARERPPVTSPPRVTPSAARGGWSAGGMAIPSLLIVVALLALAMLVLR